MNKIRSFTSNLPLLTWKGNGEMKSFPVTEWTLTQELWTIHTVCSISSTATHYQRYLYVSIASDCHVNQLILTSRVLSWKLEVLKFEYHLSCFEEQQSYTIRPANKTIRQVCVNGFKCIRAIIKRAAWNGDDLISEWCFQSEKVAHLLHLAVNSEGLVHIRGLGTTALAPNNHGSCTVELLFKLHIFLPDPHVAFPELPPFLVTKTHPHFVDTSLVCSGSQISDCSLTLSLSCRLTSCRDPTKPAAPSDDQSSDAGWSSLSCRLKAFGWFLQCSRPNGTNDCNSPAAIIVAVSSYTTSDMSPRYQHYFCKKKNQTLTLVLSEKCSTRM